MVWSQGLYTLMYLLLETFSSRRDAQVRFLVEQNKIPRDRLDQQRLILSPRERSRLLAIGKECNHQVRGLIHLVQYRTYKRWVKEQREGRPVGKVGRPRKFSQEVRDAVVRLARENVGWGYARIAGELLKLSVMISPTTVRYILRGKGIYPKPTKPGGGRGEEMDSPWQTFVSLHMDTLVACDFFCKKAWSFKRCGYRGVFRGAFRGEAYCLFFIHLQSRRVWASPATFQPDEAWVKQQARNALMWLEDQGVSVTHLIHDRDTKFTAGFDRLFESVGARVIKTPVQAPNCNAYAESWVGSLRRECLNHFVCFGLEHLDHIVQVYTKFYNGQRPHQSKDNRPLTPAPGPGSIPGSQHMKLAGDNDNPPLGGLVCHEELGGLLKHYARAA